MVEHRGWGCPARRLRRRPAAGGTDHRAGRRRRRGRARRRLGDRRRRLRHLLTAPTSPRASVFVTRPGTRDDPGLTRAVRRRYRTGARETLRAVLWHGSHPDTSDLAGKIRRLVDDGVMSPAAAQMASGLYGLGGAAFEPSARPAGGPAAGVTALDRVGRQMVHRKTPYRNGPTSSGGSDTRELNYAGIPDGLPLDPAVAMREFAAYADEEVALRGRTLRPGGRDAEVHLAHRRGLRRPGPDHAAGRGRPDRRPGAGRGSGCGCRPWVTARWTPRRARRCASPPW